MAADYTNPLLKSNKPEVKTGQYGDYAVDSLYKRRGSAEVSSSQLNKYSVSNHAYPNDIEGKQEEYGNNYAMFYINVSEDSKLSRTGSDELFVKDIPPRDQGELAASVQRNGNGSLYAIGGSIGTGLGLGVGTGKAAGGVANFFGGSKNVVKTTEYLAGTTQLGASTYGVSSSTPNFNNQTRRLKTAIKLHMPNFMSTRYSVNYEDKEMLAAGLAGAAIEGGVGLAKAFSEGGMDNVGDSLSNKSNELNSAISAATLQASQKAGIGGDVISKLGRIAPNPRREQIFRSVDFRTFQFQYDFYPRSPEEAKNVENIIYEFKYHMHPEYKDSNGFLYIYPSEFDIYYYHGSAENRHVNRHTSCVLTELTVNYAPQGQFTAFKDGMPTQINISMTFKELAPLTKERIEDGL